MRGFCKVTEPDRIEPEWSGDRSILRVCMVLAHSSPPGAVNRMTGRRYLIGVKQRPVRIMRLRLSHLPHPERQFDVIDEMNRKVSRC